MLALNAFILLLAVCLRFGREPVQLPVRLRQACLIVMLLNISSGGGMLDMRHVRPFPFMRDPEAATGGVSGFHP